MKILHICSYYLSSDLFSRLANQLEEIGIQNDIFVPLSMNDKTYWDRTTDKNESVSVARILNGTDRLFYRHKAKKTFAYLDTHYDLRSYDCIHAHSLFTNGLVAKMVKDKYGIPYIAALRNTDLNFFFKYMLLHRDLGVQIIMESKKTVFLSAAYLDRVREKYIPKNRTNSFQNKCKVIPNGIDGFWLDHKRQTPRDLSQNIRVLTVGAIEKNKNQLLVARGVKQLQDEGKDVSYTIVGDVQDADYCSKVKTVLPSIHIVPFKKKEDLIAYYDQNDIFAMTSFKETFGLVYAEALSQGLPLIYTKNEGFDKQFIDGMVGFPVLPNDIDNFVACVKLICENYKEISENCLCCSESFNWKKLAENYKQLYGE